MGLVDDVDLVLALRRREADLVAQVAHLVDAPIGSRVDLDEVEETALPDRDAVFAPIAGLAILRVRAVHGLRDETGDRRLSGASHPGQQVRVGGLPLRDRVPERSRHMLLTDDR